MWMATRPFSPTDPRPAALCLMRTGLLYLSIVSSLTLCTHHSEPLNAYYPYLAPFRPSCADFPLVFYSSPHLITCFLGSLLKASFASVWRLLFVRRGFRMVHAFTLRIRSPLRFYVLVHLANWQPLCCMVKSIFIIPRPT